MYTVLLAGRIVWAVGSKVGCLVKELIEYLSSLDQDSEVILQKDSEGNGYSR